MQDFYKLRILDSFHTWTGVVNMNLSEKVIMKLIYVVFVRASKGMSLKPVYCICVPAESWVKPI